MAAVLTLVRRTNRETIEALEWLLQEAKAGRVHDMRIGYHDQRDGEHLVLTGRYRNPNAVLAAAMRTILQKLEA